MKIVLPLLFAASALLSKGVWSAELQSLVIHRESDRYILDVTALVAVPVDVARRVVSDYDNLTSINPFLKKSKVLKQHDENRKTVHLVTGICVWHICYHVTHVQAFKWERNGDLFAEIVPELSDFSSGWMRWKLHAHGNCTRIMLHSEFVPDFIVPPLVGPYLIKKKLAEIATETMEGVENRVAAGIDPSATGPECSPPAAGH
ncbi:MAG: SRPBCC family protein [Pseudomonadota bacterium]